ncbi:hypothetical protein FDUTEX481_04836 [Tolypothrix sp. PCC 7601]|nr:hypothetical protein FDUTEX481_04836 [Tolypothrix sp. PCC 7601]
MKFNPTANFQVFIPVRGEGIKTIALTQQSTTPKNLGFHPREG